MKNYYSIISFLNNRVSDEKIAIGLVIIGGPKPIVKFSSSKINFARKINAKSAFLLEKTLDNFQNKFLNEEQMIIDHLEKPAMQSLGFGFRSGHNTSNNRSEMIQSVKSQITHRMPVKGSYYMPSPNPTKLK